MVRVVLRLLIARTRKDPAVEKDHLHGIDVAGKIPIDEKLVWSIVPAYPSRQ